MSLATVERGFGGPSYSAVKRRRGRRWSSRSWRRRSRGLADVVLQEPGQRLVAVNVIGPEFVKRLGRRQAALARALAVRPKVANCTPRQPAAWHSWCNPTTFILCGGLKPGEHGKHEILPPPPFYQSSPVLREVVWLSFLNRSLDPPDRLEAS
jgi:hypothetical protein